MTTPITALQRALGVDPDGDFGPVTAGALWARARAGRLPPLELLEAARDAMGCVSHLVIDGRRVEVPQPLWVAPYRLGELPHRPRRLPVLQAILHHDAAASAEACWRVLEDRGLSSHGAVRADGVFLQYLDLVRDVACHAAGQVLVDDAVVPASFNGQSVGIDISNPVIGQSRTRPYVQGLAQGRAYAGLGCHPCQVEATLALLRVLRRECPGISGDHWDELRWRGDVRPDTPGMWAHAQVNRQKVDPWGFSLRRLAEV